ncbi:MAG: LysE family transporter [Bacteriovoracaceae bacterium]|nr:LysE family transporter [Bacteriovoracaceae bacterium]
MDLELFLKGMVLGIAVAAPVGPIGLLCMDRSLRHGKLSGFVTGMGAALADTLYGAIATIGISGVLVFLKGHERELRFIGGLLLVFVSWRMYRTPPPKLEARQPGQKRPLARLFSESFFLTLSNPMTILGFMAVYAGLGLRAEGAHEVSTILGGVFFGSSLWWLSLSSMTVVMKHKLSPNFVSLFTKRAAIAICLFGLAALAQSLFQFKI